jgi:hypothetical protein
MPARLVKQERPQTVMGGTEIVSLLANGLSAKRRDARRDRACRVASGMGIDDGKKTARIHGDQQYLPD